ncbi:pyruvate kinase [Anaerorhabdus furcosa]|uniref:Pyruvate kinase n=1 Tax=Anaerorhabdus furcosa TaxID=118967 RepID=A0A1T4P4D6_9FIRM|nr:pyruvate kinase [Anaerorhabdus furcosa]SJZ86116.1 pyruvate kinase [Anaerorhabdus furcosa]
MIGRKTKIVCTIGPASETPEMVEKLAQCGMNIVRFNFSHDTYEGHKRRLDMVREVSDRIGINLACMLDTKGPEIRLGEFEGGACQFTKGDIVKVCKRELMGNHEHFHIQCPELFDDVKEGNIILIDDGKMKLTVLGNDGEELTCRVEVSGPIKTKKGCNVPGVKLSMPFISAKDDSDIRFGCENDYDFIAASFVRRAEDVQAIRKILIEMGKPTINIIAKIENQEGFDNLESILEVADGVMVARGDLGVEVQTQFVPIYQKQIIKVANKIGKPVITATHMLDSMTANPRPTRAEASDVANAVLDGSDAVMLSAESAAGEYPVEACTTMATIAEAVEKIIPYREKLDYSKISSKKTVQDAIGIAVSDATLTLENVGAVVAFTQGGTTARRISKFRPCVPILAVTFTKSTQRKLESYWGVTPILSDIHNELTNDDELACTIAKAHGIKPGQLIIITAGYPTGEGSANMMKVIEVK